MASTHLSLLGTLPAALHAELVARLASASETGQAYSVAETVFERLGASSSSSSSSSSSGETVPDESVLRLRATRLSRSSPKPIWSMQVYQKPESVRLSPGLLQRSLIEAPIAEGDPFALVSALGYRRRFQLVMRGVRFVRGAVVGEVYQLFEDETAPTPLDPHSYIVQLSTRSANPRAQTTQTQQPPGPSAQELKAEAIHRLEEMRAVLRGLVDLGRVE